MARLERRVWRACDAVLYPSAAEVRAAALSFAPRTAAPDGCCPRHFALLGDAGAGALAALFRLVEIFGAYGEDLEDCLERARHAAAWFRGDLGDESE